MINKYMRNSNGIKLCISQKLPFHEVPLLKNYCPKMIKAITKTIYNKLIKPGRLTPLTTITLFYSHQDHD